MHSKLESVFEFVTEHNLLVVVLLLALTAGLGAGIPQLQLGGEGGGSDVGEDTEVVRKANYVESAYLNETRSSDESNVTTAVVYVRETDGNALSKESLVASLEYQRTVRENASVAAGLDGGRVLGVANLVGKRAAGDRRASLDEQLEALRAASPGEVRRLVRETLTEGSPALQLLPGDYEPGTAEAESHRMVFTMRGADATTTDATRALHENTADTGDPTLFTLGEHARQDRPDNAYLTNVLWLVVPVSLGTILLVLAVVYRDPVDVAVGFVGILASLVWMFGLLGWLQIPAGLSVVVAPVLIIGLSVDYGLHVFMRYREERGPEEGLRAPMARSTTALASALAMVTLTAVVGFMANGISELSVIKQLAYGISLGVVGTFVVSMTLVPALKLTVDGLLARVGFERRKRPFGKSRLLAPLLGGGARVARRAAPVVLVVGLVAGAAGAAAWTDLERQGFTQSDGDVAEWKKDLPEPVGWTETTYGKRAGYVREHYRAADSSERRRSTILLEPDGTSAASAAVLDRVQAVHEMAPERSAVFTRGGSAPVRSPLTVMRSVAAENGEFRAVYRNADTDGDGVPDRNVEQVYDALFEAAPDRASRVIDRTGDGYRSVRVVVPVDPGATYADQGEQMQGLAAAVETDDVAATATGRASVILTTNGVIADSILRTMVLALAGVVALLVLVYRVTLDSATLGLVTGLPIVLVTTLVVGGMWLLDVPLTGVTALLMSLVIGLGIDYNIHVSDRFAQELRDGRSLSEALVEATTGTGGALLGSTLTTVAAFTALLLVPSPSFQNFGKLVALALGSSFVVAVFVVPSLLTLWYRYTDDHGPAAAGSSAETGAEPTPVTGDD